MRQFSMKAELKNVDVRLVVVLDHARCVVKHHLMTLLAADAELFRLSQLIADGEIVCAHVMVGRLLLEAVETITVCADVGLVLVEGCDVAGFVVFL